MADPLTPPAQGSAEKPGALKSLERGLKSLERGLARGVAAVAAARSVAKPPVSLQVGLYNIGTYRWSS